MNKTNKSITISVLVFFLTTIASCTYGQKFSIAPKIGWHGLVTFNKNDIQNDLKLFQGPSVGLDVFLNINSHLFFRIQNEYFPGYNQSIPNSNVNYQSRGIFFTPSFAITGKNLKRLSPIISIGLLTGVPEIVFKLNNAKAIYTGDFVLGINSSTGVIYKLNKKMSLIFETSYSKTDYQPSKLVNKLEDSTNILELNNVEIPLETINLSLSLLFNL